ncbi:MAG TPA: PRTRC system ThiF family protein [Ramlibacter sp.]|jgi:PRTRC genetic system ThiF family protein|nr:PRTRC system ThiF family protein [Ramlibacter sp.]
MSAPLRHRVLPALLARPIQLLLVGAGGTGSRILEKLVCLHRALVAKGHPGGLAVIVMDPDTVSAANIGRQAFYPGDIGCLKADVLVNRANMALAGACWRSVPQQLDAQANLEDCDLVIGAVDNRAARLAILRALQNCRSGQRYWLDTGNRMADGQLVLGQVLAHANGSRRRAQAAACLPHVGQLYPQLLDPQQDDPDDAPSCSLAEALERQSLCINAVIADFAVSLLWNLFTQGWIEVHGAFVNLQRVMVTPLHVDPEVWARFGVRAAAVRR